MQILNALTRALRLESDERDQVFRLAGSSPPHPGRIDLTIRPSVLRLLQRFTDLPAMILSAKADVLAQNAMTDALLGPIDRWPTGPANIAWQRFLGTGDPVLALTPEEDEVTAWHSVGSLRNAVSRYPDDPDLRALIDDLVSGSPRFAAMWADGRTMTPRSMRKTINHRDLGLLQLDCDLLLLPDTDQSLIVYSAASGSRAASALEQLRAGQAITAWAAPA